MINKFATSTRRVLLFDVMLRFAFASFAAISSENCDLGGCFIQKCQKSVSRAGVLFSSRDMFAEEEWLAVTWRC